MPAKPGLTTTEIFSALEAGTLKAIWIMCTNPVVSMPDVRVLLVEYLAGRRRWPELQLTTPEELTELDLDLHPGTPAPR